MIDALREIRTQCPSARLVVAGGGTELTKVKRYAEGLQLPSVIDFLGSVDRADVAALMRECAVFALPSFGEPYATSVIEALASGLPIVVTDSGGVAEIIDERGGVKVPTGDSHRLAAALVEILRQPEAALRMSRHNRRRVEREYAWPRSSTPSRQRTKRSYGKRDRKDFAIFVERDCQSCPYSHDM